MQVKVIHPDSGEIKSVKIGFSWTLLFFQGWVPLFRGDFTWALIIFIAGRISELSGDFGTWTIFWNRGETAWTTISFIAIFNLLIPFFYNRIYINGLFRRGFQPVEEDYETFKRCGFLNSRFHAFYWSWIEKGAAQLLISAYFWIQDENINGVLLANSTFFLLYAIVGYATIWTQLKEGREGEQESSFWEIFKSISKGNVYYITRNSLLKAQKTFMGLAVFFAIIIVLSIYFLII